MKISNELPIKKNEVVVLGVARKEFLELELEIITIGNSVVYDVKGVLNQQLVDRTL